MKAFQHPRGIISLAHTQWPQSSGPCASCVYIYTCIYSLMVVVWSDDGAALSLRTYIAHPALNCTHTHTHTQSLCKYLSLGQHALITTLYIYDAFKGMARASILGPPQEKTPPSSLALINPSNYGPPLGTLHSLVCVRPLALDTIYNIAPPPHFAP